MLVRALSELPEIDRAVVLVAEQKIAHNQQFTYTLTRFDGTTITIGVFDVLTAGGVRRVASFFLVGRCLGTGGAKNLLAGLGGALQIPREPANLELEDLLQQFPIDWDRQLGSLTEG